MMVVPWVLLLVVIVVGAGMIGWLKTTKKGTHFLALHFVKSAWCHFYQSAVDQTDLANKEREKESVYDEVKPNCAETAISLKSNIAYTTVKHTSVL